MDLINGARIFYRPLDDPDKLRSLNLTMFVIVEASEVDGEAFQQLKTRTRNMNATAPYLDEQGNPIYEEVNGQLVPTVEYDWRKGIIESNPDSGWIRSQVLYCSDEIHKHGRILDDYQVPDGTKDKAISTHVASTDANAFLPRNFIAELCKNKPGWWVNRYIFSSFSYAEGLVYPSAMAYVVSAFDIPRDWKRIIAADYGLSDDFVYLYGAIDEQHGILYIYKEVRTNNRNIEELAKIFHKECEDIPMGGLWTTPILDPKSGAKRDYNKKTLYDHLLDYGISFQPGHVNVDARVYRLNTYFEAGKIRIFNTCAGLVGELNEYKFYPKSLDATSKTPDTPMAKNNHAINPLEWIAMALPADPKKLLYGAYDGKGRSLSEIDEAKTIMTPWQFRDYEEEYKTEEVYL